MRPRHALLVAMLLLSACSSSEGTFIPGTTATTAGTSPSVSLPSIDAPCVGDPCPIGFSVSDIGYLTTCGQLSDNGLLGPTIATGTVWWDRTGPVEVHSVQGYDPATAVAARHDSDICDGGVGPKWYVAVPIAEDGSPIPCEIIASLCE